MFEDCLKHHEICKYENFEKLGELEKNIKKVFCTFYENGIGYISIKVGGSSFICEYYPKTIKILRKV